MPFNVIDKQSVSSAQDAGLSKAREISEALMLLARQGVIRLGGSLDNGPRKNQQAPGEDINDTDFNITNERHDLYKRTVEKYERSGVDVQTAKAAAIDFAIRGLGANESSHIQAAHDQISQSYLSSISTPYAKGSDVEPWISLRQRLVASGVDIDQAKAISKARDHEVGAAMREAEGNPDPPSHLTSFKELLEDTGLDPELRQYFLDEFETEIAQIKGKLPEKLEKSITDFIDNYPPNPNLASDNPNFYQQLVDDGVAIPLATRITTYREAVRSYTAENDGVVPMGADSAFGIQLKAAGVSDSLGWTLRLQFNQSLHDIIAGESKEKDEQAVQVAPKDPYQNQFTFRQRLIDAGLDSTTAGVISNQRDVEMDAAEAAAYEGNLSPGEFLPQEHGVEAQLSETTLPQAVRQSFIDEFRADLTTVTERGQRDFFTQMDVENGPPLWEQYGFDSYEEAEEERKWLEKDEAARREFLRSQANETKEVSYDDLNDLEEWTASTEDEEIEAVSSESSVLPQPLRSRKTAQAQARVESKAVLSDPLSEANVSADLFSSDESGVNPTSQDHGSLQEAYRVQLEDAGSSPETSEKAAKDLADGKGAQESVAVHQAHKEALAYRYLRDMYERVYGSLEVNLAVSKMAAKDAAKGLGANTSSHIQMAHDMAQANQSEIRSIQADNVSSAEKVAENDRANTSVNAEKESGTNISPGEQIAENNRDSSALENAQNWEKYKQLFLEARAAKYPGDNSQVSEYAMLTGAAVQAFRAEESRDTVQSMIQNSPMNNPPSGDKVTHAKKITTSAQGIAEKEIAGTAQVRPRPITKSRDKDAGIGVG